MSSAYSYSNSYAQAMLPTRGMAFAGAGNAHVHDWASSRATVTSLQPRAASTQLAGSYPGANTTSNTTGGTDSPNGSISGGLLRPGAVDQTQFKAMLNAASAGVPGAGAAGGALPMAPSSGLLPLAPNAALAAQGLQPASSASFAALGAAAANGAGAGIRNLTPAQFAVLTGGATLPGGPQTTFTGTAGQPQQVQQPAQSATGQPAPQQIAMANNLTMSDAAIPADDPGQAQTSQPATAATAPAAIPNDLTMSDAAIPADDAAVQQQASAADGSDTPDTADADAKAAADAALIGHTDKNGVLVLNMAPDRETRQEYEAKGIKWRIVDNPASDKLFFGKDGKLGWDDVLDLINPLQHIPLVNIAYRHLTGDEISGSAELLGAIPFGPVGALAAIADLAVKSVTGKDVGENVIAMVTGDHDDATGNVAQVPGAASAPSGDVVANADPDNTSFDRARGHG